MLFQYRTVFYIGTKHAGTRFIKGSATYTPSKCVPFWNIRQKTNLNDLIVLRTARIPRTALTGKGITGLDITISPIGTVLAQGIECKPNPLMLVGSYTRY